MEVIGATSAALALISTAITIVQAIKKAQARVSASSKCLAGVSSQIDSMQETLELVLEEPRLQSPSVMKQIAQIVAVLNDLEAFLGRLQDMQEKSKMRNMMHALTSGDKAEEDLQNILTRISHAQGELNIRISTVHVGITGSLRDGFEVAFKVVRETNDQVRRVLGVNLLLMEQLSNREMELVGPNNWLLEDSDVRMLELGAPAAAANSSPAPEPVAPSSTNARLEFRRNKTQKNPRIFTGSLGMDTNADKLLGPDARVTDNDFGENLRLVTANVGGTAADKFLDSFF